LFGGGVFFFFWGGGGSKKKRRGFVFFFLGGGRGWGGGGWFWEEVWVWASDGKRRIATASRRVKTAGESLLKGWSNKRKVAEEKKKKKLRFVRKGGYGRVLAYGRAGKKRGKFMFDENVSVLLRRRARKKKKSLMTYSRKKKRGNGVPYGAELLFYVPSCRCRKRKGK